MSGLGLGLRRWTANGPAPADPIRLDLIGASRQIIGVRRRNRPSPAKKSPAEL